MITFDKIKIITKANYAKNINENMGEFRYNKQHKIESYIFNQKHPFNLFIQIIPESNKLVLEFTGKILLDDYPKLISSETINQCLENINKIGYCNLSVDDIIFDSKVVSCDVTKDIPLSLSTDVKKAMISQLTNLNKFHVKKYSTTGYTVMNDVKTENCKIRLSIYDKHRDILKAGNSHFLNSCNDPESLKNYFKDKYRIESNLKTLKQIRDYCGSADTSLFNVLFSPENPLLKIFNTIFDDANENSDNSTTKRNVFEYETLSQLKDSLILKECDYDLVKTENLLNHYLAKNTNKRKYRARFRDLLNDYKPVNDNKIVIGKIRNHLIAN